MTMRDPVAVLRAEGVAVRVITGYSTRSNGNSISPIGIMLHHTASNRKGGDSAALGICVHGRSDLSGPLCNLHVSRTGVATVVALGSANHAGKGAQAVLTATEHGQAPTADARARGLKDAVGGNSHYIGIEIENDGLGEPWSPQLLDAVTRICAALCRQYGWTAQHIVCHREWTARKDDPSYRGDWRGMVAARLGGKPAPAPVTTGGAKTSFNPADAYLRLGSKGTAVKALQVRLGIKPADGDWGPATDRAVKAWQKRVGLKPDGIFGPSSQAALNKVPSPPAKPSVAKPIAAVAPAAKKPPVWWKRTLRRGSTGADVKSLQRIVGVPASQQDGVFGGQTEARVVAWQKAHKITADGIVGPSTALTMIGK